METRIKGVLSPKASGSITITENGNYDVVDVANAIVNVVPEEVGGITPEGSITLTSNGVYDVTMYAEAVVDVENVIPEGYVKPSGTLNVTSNGTFDVTEKKNVSVNVPIPEGYIKPSGTLSVTQVGTYDVSTYASATFSVITETKTVTPTASSQSVTPTSGKYLTKVTVNPIPSSYIIPSGTLTVTENGEHDVSDYATANVNVKDWFKWFIEIRGGYQFLFGNTSMSNNTLLTDSRDLIKYEDTSNYSDFKYMYYTCRNLVHINCHDTRNATDISYMCNYCDSLEDDLTFDLQNCTRANSAFQRTLKVKKIILKNTSKIQTFNSTFQNCENLEYISQLDLASCTDIAWCFRDNFKLKYIDLKNYNFSTERATNQAFSGVRTKYLIIRSFLDNYILGSNSQMAYDMKILVPREWIETLKSATNWSTHGDYIFAVEDYTIDGTTMGELDESKLV